MSILDGIVPARGLLDEESQAALNRQRNSSYHDDGRAARALGHAFETCPPFASEWMAAAWRRGWREQDERIKAKERP